MSRTCTVAGTDRRRPLGAGDAVYNARAVDRCVTSLRTRVIDHNGDLSEGLFYCGYAPPRFYTAKTQTGHVPPYSITSSARC